MKAYRILFFLFFLIVKTTLAQQNAMITIGVTFKPIVAISKDTVSAGEPLKLNIIEGLTNPYYSTIWIKETAIKKELWFKTVRYENGIAINEPITMDTCPVNEIKNTGTSNIFFSETGTYIPCVKANGDSLYHPQFSGKITVN